MRTFVASVITIGLAVQGLLAAYPDRPGIPAARQDQAALAPPSLAEQCLFQLADQMKKRRRLGGTLCIAIGGATVAGGLALVSVDEDKDWLGLTRLTGAVVIAEGVVVLGVGAHSLAARSRAERADIRVRAVSDAAARELAAEDALAGLARKARSARKIRGWVLIAVGAVAAPTAEEDSGALTVGALVAASAAYSFLVKSPEEKAYRSYKERKGPRLVPDLVLSVTPRGGILAGLALSF